MERKRDGFVPLGDVVDGLSLPGGRALTHRAAAPLARHHFTTLQQVNQLVAASEADADLGFMARLAPRDAEAQIAAMRQDATAQVNEFRSTYPTRLQFPYALDDKAGRWPFLVQGMWHDGQFTYLRSTAQETPALYENTDGQPSLIPYDLEADGLFIVRRLVGSGWLQIGRERAGWKVDLDDLE